MNTRTVRVPKARLLAAAFAVVAGSSVLFSGASVSAAADAPDSLRVAGENRYATAVEVAQTTYAEEGGPGCYDYVTIVNGENWPDGLSAAVFSDPILLTRADGLPAETRAELERVAACNAEESNQIYVNVIGGTSAVSNAVYGEIAQIATYIDMNRIAGANRYETAIAVAEDYGHEGCVIMVTGENYPDALAAGPMSYWADAPIILNNGDSVRADVGAYLVAEEVGCVYIVGGTSAIPQSVEDELAGFYDMYVERLAGDTRAETAVAIAEWLIDDDSDWEEGVTLVNQDGFADALAASDLAYDWDYPILMVGANSIPAATAAFHVENCADIDEILAIGGTSAISDAVLEGAVGAATCATPAVTSVTLAISDETSRTITLTTDDDGDSLGSETVKLTAVEAGVVANEYEINFSSSPVPADWGLEVDGFVLEYTDNFDSLDELTFVANWNAADGGRFFTASGGEADTTWYDTPDYVLSFDGGDDTSQDDVLAEATMTIVVNFNIPVYPDTDGPDLDFDWAIWAGSNPSIADDYLFDESDCLTEVWAEDGLSYTCATTNTYLSDWDDDFIPVPRIGIDSFRVFSNEFYAVIGDEANDDQLVTLSAP